MSYKTSIKNVAIDLDISDEKAVTLIIDLINEVGSHHFTRRTLEDRFSDIEISSFLNNFQTIIDEQISYECLIEGEQEITKNTNDMCEFCNSNIVGNSDHETEDLYILSDYELLKKWLKEYEKKQYFILQYQENLDELLSSKNNIIPFVGSGLSIPFGIPDWGGLLEEINPTFEKTFQEEQFLDHLSNGEFMEALDLVKQKSLNIGNEKQLQKKIVSILTQKESQFVNKDSHNYLDLLKLNSNFYITTNYDLILSKLISEYQKYTYPLTFNEMDDSYSIHINHNQVLHLHGHIKKENEMVVSKESYEKFYKEIKNTTKLASLIGSKKLLFIGFSFNDAFFEDLYNQLNDVIGNDHFIIVANPKPKTVRKFLEKSLRVIGLNVKVNSEGRYDSLDYVKALRLLLEYLE